MSAAEEEECPECIPEFLNNTKAAVDYLRSLNVLPKLVKCPMCMKDCSLREDQQIWRCRQSYLVPKTQKRRPCVFSVSDYRDTFLHHVNLAPWKVVLFVNHWLTRGWSPAQVTKCLRISHCTSYDWRFICSQVTDCWFENQESIGGEGVVVEIDKTLLVHEASTVTKAWLFGGVERGTRRSFTVPILLPKGGWQERGTLLPLIIRFIRPGSIIITDNWAAYNNLNDHGYTHFVTNPSKDTVQSVDIDVKVHLQNIECLWTDLREWVKRPGTKSQFFYQGLAKFLFIRTYEEDNILGHFFETAAQLYPHQGGNRHKQPPSRGGSEAAD